MKYSLLVAPIFVQAVLHKEFVGAKSDKLLANGPSKAAPGIRASLKIIICQRVTSPTRLPHAAPACMLA